MQTVGEFLLLHEVHHLSPIAGAVGDGEALRVDLSILPPRAAGGMTLLLVFFASLVESRTSASLASRRTCTTTDSR